MITAVAEFEVVEMRPLVMDRPGEGRVAAAVDPTTT
jgi:hypothetical protein